MSNDLDGKTLTQFFELTKETQEMIEPLAKENLAVWEVHTRHWPGRARLMIDVRTAKKNELRLAVERLKKTQARITPSREGKAGSNV